MVEIRAAARLQHPNIVAAYCAFACGDSVLFAMEYIEGHDLAELVRSRGPLPVITACYYIHQAAQALGHANEQGFVHRDIKPGNLMLAQTGDRPVIKVLNFGLAKAKLESNLIDFHHVDATRESETAGFSKADGPVPGTLNFIAPEQIADSRNADIRADLYSLGCTLYYLLSGRPPFPATRVSDVLQAHHSMDARLLNLVRPEVPLELAALVAKMMAKEPEQRFQTPDEIAQALVPFFSRKATTDRKLGDETAWDRTGIGTSSNFEFSLVGNVDILSSIPDPPGSQRATDPAEANLHDHRALAGNKGEMFNGSALPRTYSRFFSPVAITGAGVAAALLGAFLFLPRFGGGARPVIDPETVIKAARLEEAPPASMPSGPGPSSTASPLVAAKLGPPGNGSLPEKPGHMMLADLPDLPFDDPPLEKPADPAHPDSSREMHWKDSFYVSRSEDAVWEEAEVLKKRRLEYRRAILDHRVLMRRALR